MLLRDTITLLLSWVGANQAVYLERYNENMIQDQFQCADEDPVASVYDIPEDAKVILKDNRRGRLLDKAEKGFMVHIVFDDGYHLITDP